MYIRPARLSVTADDNHHYICLMFNIIKRNADLYHLWIQSLVIFLFTTVFL